MNNRYKIGAAPREKRTWFRRSELALGVTLGIVILAGGAALFLLRGPQPTNRPPPADECTELGHILEDHDQQTNGTTRNLVAVFSDAGFGISGTDTVEQVVRKTYANFDNKTEACRILNVSVQCADKRQPNSAVALKLVDAVTAVCGSVAGLPSPGTKQTVAPERNEISGPRHAGAPDVASARGDDDAGSPNLPNGCVASLTSFYVLRKDGVLLLEGDPSSPHAILDAGTGFPLQGIINVETASYHGCAALKNGTVRCWQADQQNGNARGQLGNGTTSSSAALFLATPVLTGPSAALSGVVRVATASPAVWGNIPTASSCAITERGRVWCWGELTWLVNNGTPLPSGYAQEITIDGSTPLASVTSVALGVHNACAIVSGHPNTLWCWGHNSYGELGLGDTKQRQYPTQVLGLRNPTKVTINLTRSYYQNSAVCTLDGENVRCWGDNSFGAGGSNTTTNPILTPTPVVMQNGTALSEVSNFETGLGDFAALRKDSTMWVWGAGFAGYAANYGVTNVREIGWAGPPRQGGPRYLTSDGIYHAALTNVAVNCNAM